LNEVVAELREGSLFEPVRAESFDLIVSNPPFVISPEAELLFRHSALNRDEVSRDVVRSAAAHLRQGGFGYILINWIQPPERPWLDVLGEWLEGSGCDAVGLLYGIEDPLAYSARWTAREQQLRPDRHGETLDRWLAHFRRERIAAIGSGALVIRRRAGPNWMHGLELSRDSASDARSDIQAIFAGRDVLSITMPADGDEDAGLLAAVLRMRMPHRVTQTLVARDGEYTADPAALSLDQGLGLPVQIPNDLVPVLLRLDGSQSGLDIAREVAAGTGSGLDEMKGRVADLLRVLLDRGFVDVVTAGGETGAKRSKA
jgi:hypothetical protein